MTTFWLAMTAIVFGSLLAMAVLYGVMRLVGLVVLGVAWVLVMWLRASGRAARSAVHAAVAHVTPLHHRTVTRHSGTDRRRRRAVRCRGARRPPGDRRGAAALE